DFRSAGPSRERAAPADTIAQLRQRLPAVHRFPLSHASPAQGRPRAAPPRGPDHAHPPRLERAPPALRRGPWQMPLALTAASAPPRFPGAAAAAPPSPVDLQLLTELPPPQ